MGIEDIKGYRGILREIEGDTGIYSGMKGYRGIYVEDLRGCRGI